MRRSLFCAVFFGMLVALLPAGAAVADTCDENFGARLKCWSQSIDEFGVLVTLDDQVPFDDKAGDLGATKQTLWDNRQNLVVEVPEGGKTGEGGTALLLLAGTGWVDPKATIDRLPQAARQGLPACEPAKAGDPGYLTELHSACGLLAAKSLTGQELIDAAPATYRAKQSFSVSTSGKSSVWDDLPLVIVSALLVVLLAALVLAIRRSSRAAPRRTLAAAGGGTIPTTNSRAADEKTTHLRVE